MTVAVKPTAPASAPSPAAMSLTFGDVEATPVVVPLSPPRIVTVPTTGPVADHVIRPELTDVPPVAVNVNVSVAVSYTHLTLPTILRV